MKGGGVVIVVRLNNVAFSMRCSNNVSSGMRNPKRNNSILCAEAIPERL
jgi:hypothetical protein